MTNRFTEEQIVTIYKEADAGGSVDEILRTYGVSRSSFYKWRSKYGGWMWLVVAPVILADADTRNNKAAILFIIHRIVNYSQNLMKYWGKNLSATIYRRQRL